MSIRQSTLKKILFSRRETAAASSMETFGFAIAGAAFAFLRNLIIAARYGAGALSDAYFASVGIVISPATHIADALTALVPPRSQAYRKEHREAEFVASYLAMVALAFIVLSFIFIVFGKNIVTAVVRGLSGQTLETTYFLVLLSLPAIVFSPLCVVLDFALRSERYFIFGNIAGLLNSALSAVLLLFAAKMGVAGIVVTTFIGIFINFVVVLVAAFKKKLMPGRINLHLGFHEIKSVAPLVVGALFAIASTYVEKYLASFLASGSITLLSMSISLIVVAKGMFVMPLISVYYPFISAALGQGDHAAYGHYVEGAKKIIFGILGLAMLCMIVFSPPLFSLLFGHGRFTEADVAMLARIFSAGVFIVVQSGFLHIVQYSFYALGDTKRPTAIVIGIATLGGILLQYSVVGWLGAIGLSAATAVAGAMALLAGIVTLSKKYALRFLSRREIILLFVLLAISVVSGFIRWSPWYMLAPCAYYYGISVRHYGLTPAAFVKLLAGARQHNKGRI